HDGHCLHPSRAQGKLQDPSRELDGSVWSLREGAGEGAPCSSVHLDDRPIRVGHPPRRRVGGCEILAVHPDELRLGEGGVERKGWLAGDGVWPRGPWIECHPEPGLLARFGGAVIDPLRDSLDECWTTPSRLRLECPRPLSRVVQNGVRYQDAAAVV